MKTMRLWVGGVLAVAALPVFGADICSQAPDPVAMIVARAAGYVGEYERRFTGIVGEERQTQRLVKANGGTAKQRALVSDIVLVRSGNRTSFFRDVIAVDGKPVGDRQKRLEKLFVDGPTGALEQARAIVTESARFDLEFPHLRGILALPLMIVKPGIAERFRFARTDDGVSLEETRSPTLVTYREGSRSWGAMLHGRLAIDAEGRLSAASLTWANDLFDGAMDVRYGEHPTLGLLVPQEMRETYRHPRKPKEDHLEIASTYTNYRRFEVKVEEQIALPQ